MTTRALVLGGGGIAGIAWETGILAGLAAGGADVTGADLVVGTSAGSTVAAQVTSDVPLADLFERLVAPAGASGELTAPSPVSSLEQLWMEMVANTSDPIELRRAIGAMALATDTVPEEERLRVIAGRLPRHAWPDRPVRIVAVDALTGDERIFDEGGDTSLVEAVAASSSVPGIWPPVTIDGRRYIDGGIRSVLNADLAVGHDVVLILAPIDEPLPVGPDVAAGMEDLGARARIRFVRPDDASTAAFGPDLLDPASRAPSARAGRNQGQALAESVRSFWG
ncbi:MAG TPA: patatin-like phospholipase family protein [Acidimicrobiales bacterium]|jgi:NTE family protein|nr:patatin-like phospholipase family protein [Acidimicrobiales bacterium]